MLSSYCEVADLPRAQSFREDELHAMKNEEPCGPSNAFMKSRKKTLRVANNLLGIKSFLYMIKATNQLKAQKNNLMKKYMILKLLLPTKNKQSEIGSKH